MKVVINECYGGFGLSQEAIKRLIKMGMTVGDNDCDIYAYEDEEVDDLLEETMGLGKYHIANAYDSAFRSDHRVIQVVEEMGEDSWGRFAELKIIEVPDDVEWDVKDYDGREWVAEKHRTWS
jgi:hypothetical protein